MTRAIRKIRIVKMRVLSSSLPSPHGLHTMMQCELKEEAVIVNLHRCDIGQWTWLEMQMIYSRTTPTWDLMRNLAKSLKASEAWLIISNKSEAIDLLERDDDELEQCTTSGKPDPRPGTEDTPERIVRV